jgi:exonuclease VII large subunit
LSVRVVAESGAQVLCERIDGGLLAFPTYDPEVMQSALPCAVWRNDWDAILARVGAEPQEGMQLVVAGGCDYYPGSATASPSFSFAVSDLRVAGECDLLARI